MTIHSGGGYAVRRVNRCLKHEEFLPTWNHYYACCPDGMMVDTDTEDNNTPFCRGPDSDIGHVPQVCTNSTWTLYYNSGFLCCDQNTTAFVAKSNGDTSKEATFGCDSPNYMRQMQKNHEDWEVYPIKPYTTPGSEAGKGGPNKGAIAGGVVGGVCGLLIILGLIWFFLRRRRLTTVSQGASNSPYPMTSDAAALSDFRHQPSEAEGNNKVMGELYDPAPMRTELEADKTARHELHNEIPKRTNNGPPSELP